MTFQADRRTLSRELLRDVNQRVASLGSRGDEILSFLCECADEFCDGRVKLERTQWESIASTPNDYVMLPGHPRSEGEIVVGGFDGYEVVRKPD